MKRVLFSVACVFVVSNIHSPMSMAQQKVQANDLVELFEKMSGKHPGYRKAHAKGLCASGTFIPSQESGPFSSSALLSSGDLPVTLRFSLGGGNPNADERAPGTRGMGMQISLPDGLHMFTGNNFPVFGGKDPDTFYGFLKTLLPDESGKRDPAKTIAYIKANPSVAAHAAWQQAAQTPASYANTEFFGLHTFYFDPVAGDRVKFRWNLVPDLGVKTLSKEQAATLPEVFLAETMSRQLKEQKVSYSLQVSLGEAQDTDTDPSVQWPVERPVVTLGKVVLNAAGGEACDPLNFDPNIMSAGFAPSADPILRMRSPAYAISFGKRLSGQ